jgi:hypothetical protein
VIGDREPGIGGSVLGYEADAGELFGRCPWTATKDGDRPGARSEESHGELQQRALAGAVRPEEPLPAGMVRVYSDNADFCR